MSNTLEAYWWGVEACLDEETTQTICTAVDVGSCAAAVAAAVEQDPEAKMALALGGAFARLGSIVVKAVDREGGSHGVCVYRPWVGPVEWVKARPA